MGTCKHVLTAAVALTFATSARAQQPDVSVPVVDQQWTAMWRMEAAMAAQQAKLAVQSGAVAMQSSLAQTAELAMAEQQAKLAVQSGTVAMQSSLAQTADLLQATMMPWGIGIEAAHAPSYPEDPADSLYRVARGEFSRGNLDAAITLFQQVRRQYPDSRYAPYAMYYEAFALYRQGGEPRLRQALAVLQTQIDKYPTGVTRDTAGLAARIQGQLAQLGDASAAEDLVRQADELVAQTQFRAQGQSQVAEDDARMVALNALMQMDAENAMPILERVLANHSAETAPLRRKAVFLVAQKHTAGREEILLNAARNDPDEEVRKTAIFHLSQVRTPEAVEALDSVLKFSTDRELQEQAIFALSQHRSERAAEILQDFALDAGAPPELRAHAIQWLGNTRSANAAFLRELFTRLDDEQLKERTLFALSQRRDSANADFLVDVALDETQSMETRKKALFWAGQMRMDNVRLYDLYDRAIDRDLKEQLIFVYSQRLRDDAAIDKLIDIARNETDPHLRNKAIFWLGRTNDPRAIQLLEEIINND
jgi:HEAT repeat protein